MIPTHIINPIGEAFDIHLHKMRHGCWVECCTKHLSLETFSGQTLPTEAQAVSQWNAMFSKAPYVAHKGEV